jgi:hypothetical protein
MKMIATSLACGPVFSEMTIPGAIAVLFVVKPLLYFGFIQAFKYRVSRFVPMSSRRAWALAGTRAAAGLATSGLAYLFVSITHVRLDDWIALTWGLLIAERCAMWFALGVWGAGLRGRRLLGWTISGVGIDVAYDGAIAAGALFGLGAHLVVTIFAVIFIHALHVVGRRDSLKQRFSNFNCRQCGYDLCGNLSGICPECGGPVAKMWLAENVGS